MSRFFIHPEQANGNAPLGCQRCDTFPNDGEMLVPALGARMKEPTDLAGVRVDPRDVGPLEQIATTTRESEVVFRIGSTMLTGNNVLDVEAVITLISSQVAVLALTWPAGLPQPGCAHFHGFFVSTLVSLKPLAVVVALQRAQEFQTFRGESWLRHRPHILHRQEPIGKLLSVLNSFFRYPIPFSDIISRQTLA